MPRLLLRHFLPVAWAAMLALAAPAMAQGGDAKTGEQAKATGQPDSGRDRQKSVDEIKEAERALQGAAGRPECVWFGRRVVSLLWRDDLDTALRHLGLYERFGCPGDHVQASFRCVVRNGNLDPRVPEHLANRIQACWVDPDLRPASAAVPPAATQTPAPQKP